MHFNHLISTLVLACLVSGCSESDTDSLEITKTDNGQLENVDSINVSLREASLAAMTFIKEAMPDKRLSRSSALPKIISENGVPAMYVINFENGGYVVISAVKKLAPVLAYGKTGSFDGTGCPGVEDWTESVKYLAYNTDKIQPDSAKVNMARWRRFESINVTPLSRKSDSAWDNMSPDRREYLSKVIMDSVSSWHNQGLNVYNLSQLKMNNPDLYNIYDEAAKSGTWVEYQDYYEDLTFIVEKPDISYEVPVLIQTKWAQSGSFNQTLPILSNGKHALAGCGPVAAGQVMYYYKHPTNINWDGMYLYSGTDATSEFLYDLGKRAKAKYMNDKTSTELEDLQNAINQYGYTSNIDKWNSSKALSNVDKGKPVIIGGQDKLAEGGHAYILDGYSYFSSLVFAELWIVTDPKLFQRTMSEMSNDGFTQYLYHINWGWGGFKDDYFSDMSNLYIDYTTTDNKHKEYMYNSKRMICDITPVN